jgi:hypothetical protein
MQPGAESVKRALCKMCTAPSWPLKSLWLDNFKRSLKSRPAGLKASAVATTLA